MCRGAARVILAATVAMDLAGEAIAVVRTSKGELVALSNICRHRGTPLLDEGFGMIEKNIICPYHAWTYSHEGDLKAIPFSGGGRNRQKAALSYLSFMLVVG